MKYQKTIKLAKKLMDRFPECVTTEYDEEVKENITTYKDDRFEFRFIQHDHYNEIHLSDKVWETYLRFDYDGDWNYEGPNEKGTAKFNKVLSHMIELADEGKYTPISEVIERELTEDEFENVFDFLLSYSYASPATLRFARLVLRNSDDRFTKIRIKNGHLDEIKIDSYANQCLVVIKYGKIKGWVVTSDEETWNLNNSIEDYNKLLNYITDNDPEQASA